MAPEKLSHLLGVPSILSHPGVIEQKSEDLVKQHTLLKSYSRFHWKNYILHEAKVCGAGKYPPTSFQWGFQDQDLRHQWHHPSTRGQGCSSVVSPSQATQATVETKIVGSCWPHASPEVDLRGADEGTSSNGDPIAPTLSSILGRGIVTLAKCVVLRLSALFFADEKTVPWKITIEEGVFLIHLFQPPILSQSTVLES